MSVNGRRRRNEALTHAQTRPHSWPSWPYLNSKPSRPMCLLARTPPCQQHHGSNVWFLPFPHIFTLALALTPSLSPLNHPGSFFSLCPLSNVWFDILHDEQVRAQGRLLFEESQQDYIDNNQEKPRSSGERDSFDKTIIRKQMDNGVYEQVRATTKKRHWEHGPFKDKAACSNENNGERSRQINYFGTQYWNARSEWIDRLHIQVSFSFRGTRLGWRMLNNI